MLTVLAGGVGAARFLRGLVRVVDPRDVSVVVNVADDLEISGLHISPDLDTVTYTLAGLADRERGWGLAGESWHAMEMLEKLGGETWFRLGDRDLGTHLYRTARLSQGADLALVTSEICKALGVQVELLPATCDRLRTKVTLTDGEEVAFQEWFVKMQHSVPVRSVRFEGAEHARPARGVLEALRRSEGVIIAPSNPFVSIAPVLAVKEIEQAVREAKSRVVAVSPIVAGRALKGPADRLAKELGFEASVVGVARYYAGLISALVVDEADAREAPRVEELGVRCVVAPAIMHDDTAAARLAEATLDALGSRR